MREGEKEFIFICNILGKIDLHFVEPCCMLVFFQLIGISLKNSYHLQKVFDNLAYTTALPIGYLGRTSFDRKLDG